MLGRTEKNRGNPHVAEVRPHIADNSVSELTGNPRLGGFPGALLGDGQVEAAKLCLEMDVMAMRCLQGRQIGLLAGDGRVPVMPVRMHTAAGRVKIVSDEGKVDVLGSRDGHGDGDTPARPSHDSLELGVVRLKGHGGSALSIQVNGSNACTAEGPDLLSGH